jgi:hypothetical protein
VNYPLGFRILSFFVIIILLSSPGTGIQGNILNEGIGTTPRSSTLNQTQFQDGGCYNTIATNDGIVLMNTVPPRINWTKMQDGFPGARYKSEMVYDEITSECILFGGSFYNGGGGSDNNRGYADTWFFNSSNRSWRAMNNISNMPAMAEHKMIFDEKHRCVILRCIPNYAVHFL